MPTSTHFRELSGRGSVPHGGALLSPYSWPRSSTEDSRISLKPLQLPYTSLVTALPEVSMGADMSDLEGCGYCSLQAPSSTFLPCQFSLRPPLSPEGRNS